jgi:putative ABC transport system ATP-binding protein
VPAVGLAAGAAVAAAPDEAAATGAVRVAAAASGSARSAPSARRRGYRLAEGEEGEEGADGAGGTGGAGERIGAVGPTLREATLTIMTAIKVEHLGKKVPDAGGWLTILDDVGFVVEPGDTVAIVGASGSGKSTLLGLLAGLDLPTSGKVIASGQDLFALDEDARAMWRAANVGFVFQSFQLLPQMTALENVMLPLELAGARDASPRSRELLGRVGLADRVGHYPRTLSGGEQQRVALARAFASQPKLLFADEPTGSLDHATGERIIELLFELNRESGATLVLVTHDPALARRCGRTLSLRSGRLQAD